MPSPMQVLSRLRNDPSGTWEIAKSRLASQRRLQDYGSTTDYRSDSDDGLYLAAVRRAVDSQKHFARFKRNLDYREILEHTSRAQAECYLDIVREQTPEFFDQLDAFRSNDLLGDPVIEQFDGVGALNPSTARYMKVASDLVTLFDPLDKAHVVEVGAGFGGQMLVCDQVMSIQTYTMFDLPPVLDLISKYLESFLLKGSYETRTINTCAGMTDFDLVISNYAFSELPQAVQECYIEKVLSHARRGYLTMNSGVGKSHRDANKMTLASLRARLPESRILEERPLSSPGNYILAWGTGPA